MSRRIASFLYSTFRCFFALLSTHRNCHYRTSGKQPPNNLDMPFVHSSLSLMTYFYTPPIPPPPPPPNTTMADVPGGKNRFSHYPSAHHFSLLPCRSLYTSTQHPSIHPSIQPTIQSLSLSPLKHAIILQTQGFLLPTLTQMILLTNWLHQHLQRFHLPFGQQSKFRTKEHKMFKTCIQMWCHL